MGQEQKGYEPSEEEMKIAEESMTPEQKSGSEAREKHEVSKETMDWIREKGIILTAYKIKSDITEKGMMVVDANPDSSMKYVIFDYDSKDLKGIAKSQLTGDNSDIPEDMRVPDSVRDELTKIEDTEW